MKERKLLIATHNQGKVVEFVEMMDDFGVQWISLRDAGITLDVPETGTTLLENAQLKAETYARASGLLTLADDTGLEIDALGGDPGIYPARYGGKGLTSIERYELVLRNLRGVAMAQRTARFRCVIALAHPQKGLLDYSEGVCEGHITDEATGEGGFGYDPIFVPASFQQSFAQMDGLSKHLISHRGKAVRGMGTILKQRLTIDPNKQKP